MFIVVTLIHCKNNGVCIALTLIHRKNNGIWEEEEKEEEKEPRRDPRTQAPKSIQMDVLRLVVTMVSETDQHAIIWGGESGPYLYSRDANSL